MKGIILAAGKGTRLYPITKPICKPLLPVYDKPMIYYSLSVLMRAGIREILIIVPESFTKAFVDLLGYGDNLGIHIQYKEQIIQRGIADAFIIGEDFIADDDVCLMLGDNIFYGPLFRKKLRNIVRNFKDAVIFGYYVDDPRPFGVVEFDEEGTALSIEEKPKHPKSNYIVPGLYFYDNSVIEIAKKLEPSKRGELEITAVNNEYLKRGTLHVESLGSEYTWFDTGTADSLYIASGTIRSAQRSGKLIGCPEEQALRNRWITVDQLHETANELSKTEYGQYLFGLIDDIENRE